MKQERKNSVPRQVRKVAKAMRKNAREAWGADDPIANDVVHVSQQDDGRWTIADNYERFFSTIYIYEKTSQTWTIRTMYAGDEERPYDLERALSDASIMFTG